MNTSTVLTRVLVFLTISSNSHWEFRIIDFSKTRSDTYIEIINYDL